MADWEQLTNSKTDKRFSSIDQCLQIFCNWNKESTTKTKRQESSQNTKPVPKLLRIKKFQHSVVPHLKSHLILCCEYIWDHPLTSPNVYHAKFQFTLPILVEHSRLLCLAVSAQWPTLDMLLKHPAVLSVCHWNSFVLKWASKLHQKHF